MRTISKRAKAISTRIRWRDLSRYISKIQCEDMERIAKKLLGFAVDAVHDMRRQIDLVHILVLHFSKDSSRTPV
jgi:hypothetical protein